MGDEFTIWRCEECHGITDLVPFEMHFPFCERRGALLEERYVPFTQLTDLREAARELVTSDAEFRTARREKRGSELAMARRLDAALSALRALLEKP